MAEENFNKLTKMLGELFPDDCYFSFNKKEEHYYSQYTIQASRKKYISYNKYGNSTYIIKPWRFSVREYLG